MKLFIEVPEIHKFLVEITVSEKPTIDEIINAVNEQLDNSDELTSEYSHTLEFDEWIIEDKDRNHLVF